MTLPYAPTLAVHDRNLQLGKAKMSRLPLESQSGYCSSVGVQTTVHLAHVAHHWATSVMSFAALPERSTGKHKEWAVSNTYVIDGVNVCWWLGGKMSIKPLLTLIQSILENDDDIFCVFDASVTFDLKKHSDLPESAIIENFLIQHTERFFRVTGSSRADGVILHNADYNNRCIITNDTYRDYQEKYAWLSNKYTERLIQGNLQPSGLMTLDKLDYGHMVLISDVAVTAKKITELISVNKSPKIYEIENLISRKRSELADLDKQIKVRETSILEMDRCLCQVTASHKKLEEDIRTAQPRADELRSEVAAISAELKRLHGIRDLDAVAAKIRDKISKLNSEAVSLESANRASERELSRVSEEARAYQRLLDQKAVENEVKMKEAKDIQAYIRKTNAEIVTFLEPYQIGRTHKIRIPFEGNLWDVAIHGLSEFLYANRICEKCYNIDGYHRKDARCQACGKHSLTDTPLKIIEIVNNNVPPGGQPFDIFLRVLKKAAAGLGFKSSR